MVRRNSIFSIYAGLVTCGMLAVLITGCMETSENPNQPVGRSEGRTEMAADPSGHPVGPKGLDVGGHMRMNDTGYNNHDLYPAQSIAAQLRSIPRVNHAYVLYSKSKKTAYVAVDVKAHDFNSSLRSQVIQKVHKLDSSLQQVLVTSDFDAVQAFREYYSNIDEDRPTSTLWNSLHNVDEVINRITAKANQPSTK